jgi:hypothetical protein
MRETPERMAEMTEQMILHGTAMADE